MHVRDLHLPTTCTHLRPGVTQCKRNWRAIEIFSGSGCFVTLLTRDLEKVCGSYCKVMGGGFGFDSFCLFVIAARITLIFANHGSRPPRWLVGLGQNLLRGTAWLLVTCAAENSGPSAELNHTFSLQLLFPGCRARAAFRACGWRLLLQMRFPSAHLRILGNKLENSEG
jgi:hypothetical protein